MALKDSAGASTPATARGRSRYEWMEREVAVSLSQGPLAGSASVARLASGFSLSYAGRHVVHVHWFVVFVPGSVHLPDSSS